jgi:peptidoglycan/LPS O-acetylase OafA/YrhL
MIPGLDGLRAIAFFLVFLLHNDYFAFGWVGVQFFFVLSGFLITGILLDMKQSLPSKDYYTKFYGRRFLRIFPLYYFYLLLMAGVTSWLKSQSYRQNYMELFHQQLPYALTYVYNFFYASSSFVHTKFLDHFWSLSVEEQFYVVWPLLIMLVPRKHLKKLFVSGMIFAPLFRIAMLFVFRLFPNPVFRGDFGWFIYPLPLTHIDAFAFGAFISRFEISKPRLQLVVLSVAVPVLGFASQYLSTGELGNWSSLGYPIVMRHAYEFVWGYSLLNYWFAVIIYCVVKDGLFTKVLDARPMRYLGKISYGLYVYHFGLIWFAGRIRDYGITDETIAKPLTALIALVLTIVVASLSYYLLEKPILRLKDRYFPLKSKARMVDPANMAG